MKLKKKPFFLSGYSFRLAGMIAVLALSAGLSSGLYASVEFSKIAIHKNYIIISAKSDSTNFMNIERVINDGLTVKLTYTLTLYKKGGMFNPYQPVTNLSLVYLARRDLINKGYEAEISYGEDSRGRWFPASGDLIGFLLNIKNLRVLRLGLLKKKQDYFLELRQDIVSLDLTPPLSFIYSLFGNWNYSSRKTRSRDFNRNGILNE